MRNLIVVLSVLTLAASVNGAFAQGVYPKKVYIDPGHGGTDPGALTHIVNHIYSDKQFDKRIDSLVLLFVLQVNQNDEIREV